MKFRAHQKGITALTIHPQDQYLVTGHTGGAIYAWDYHQGQPRAAIRDAGERSQRISSLAFNPDGTVLACAITYSALKGRVELRDTQQWGVLSVIDSEQVYDLSWSPDGSVLVIAKNDILIMSSKTYKETNRLEDLSGRNHCVTFSKSGEYLLAGGDYYDPSIGVWNTKTFEFTTKMPNDETDIAATNFVYEPFQFVHSSDNIFLLYDANGLFEYNIQQNRLTMRWEPEEFDDVSAVAVSPDGQSIAYATTVSLETGLVRIKDIQTGQLLHKVTDLSCRVGCLHFVENTKLIIGDMDGFITVEESNTHKRAWRFIG